ncbi:MAG: hypothetical protein IJN44_12390, partial [Clostridia bacterium]|nr:hypothetical protein [Clostridia bacterium]
GRRRTAANRMQSIRGKREKTGRKVNFPDRLFSSFSLCPWCCFCSFLNFHAETILFDTIVYRTLGPGPMALVRGTGAAQAPASFGHTAVRPFYSGK